MFVIFNIFFIIYYYLFDMFNFLTKYLFPIAEINYLVLKMFFQNVMQTKVTGVLFEIFCHKKNNGAIQI